MSQATPAQGHARGTGFGFGWIRGRSGVPQLRVDARAKRFKKDSVVWLYGVSLRRQQVTGVWNAITSSSKESKLKTTLQELLIYLIFLIDLCILAFGMVSTEMYYLNQAMSNLFLESEFSETELTTFKMINSMEDFWKFAEGPLLEGLYWNKWYDKMPAYENESYIYYENILLGVPRIRQLKVQSGNCYVHGYFLKMIRECYGVYSSRYEDRSSFGLMNGTAWTYSFPSTYTAPHWGYFGYYSSGGYYLDLAKTKNESAEKIAFLKSNHWFDHRTRAVFIDFTTYNANVNLFCVIRLTVEFPPTGGAVPSWHLYSVKLLRYFSMYDYFVASCEIIFCLFTFAFLGQEFIEIWESKTTYFKNTWNCVDVLLGLLSLVAIAFNIFRTTRVSMVLHKLIKLPDDYADFYFLAYWQTQYNNMIAVIVFIAWIKIFKFINFNKTMTQLASTLSRCAKDIIGFAIMFFIIFFSYAQLGYLVFGTQVDDFSTFENCIFTQFRIILGDFDFATIEMANRVLGPIYFITFVFFVFFILLNMFLAIINETYAEVKADLSMQNPEFEISDLIRKSYNKALVKLKLKKAAVNEFAECVRKASGEMNLEKLQQDMEKRGYSEKETKAIFNAYDIDKNEELHKTEGQKIDQKSQEVFFAIF
ncbi:polycystin-2-like protein 2 [Latimeria chalumnae]|uniref:polycystin-2-like protein 2 n=1 Tax=Latimeria chalumnae TaxID=7897 RepID=UPI00313DD5BD